MSPERKYLLKRKSNLRCALYTGVKTDHPGFVKCILTQPLYSSDGSVILAEAGAELDGEQKVEIKPGQSSVFTSWTDLETSVGVRATLNALGTGAMGESGTNAYVDNHNGQRYGGAVMLSFIQDAFASAANSTKKIIPPIRLITVKVMLKVWQRKRWTVALIFLLQDMYYRVRLLMSSSLRMWIFLLCLRHALSVNNIGKQI